MYAIDTAGNTSVQRLSLNIISGQSSLPAIYFSTISSVLIPGLERPYDDANIYTWDGNVAENSLIASDIGLDLAADIDAIEFVSPTHFYVSFLSTTTVPGIGRVLDRDVVEYSDGVWSLYSTGSSMGLTTAAHDIDALSFYDNTLYFSILGNTSLPGVGAVDDADILRWTGTQIEKVWRASDNGLPGIADIVGLSVVSENHYLLSFNAANTLIPDLGYVQDEDIVVFNNGLWSVTFDGADNGFTNTGHDIDGLSLGAVSVVAQVLDTTPPSWTDLQISALSVSSNSIELEWLEAGDDTGVVNYHVTYQNGDTTKVSTSSTSSIVIPGLSSLTSYFFRIEAVDESGNVSVGGPTIAVTTEEELDAPQASFYFSTIGASTIPGLNSPDDADIYAWDGYTFSRLWDATQNGLSASADIDALTVLDNNSYLISFNASNVSVAGLGLVQDEDVLSIRSLSTFSAYFESAIAIPTKDSAEHLLP